VVVPAPGHLSDQCFMPLHNCIWFKNSLVEESIYASAFFYRTGKHMQLNMLAE
jgi:hypothetical protein